MLRTTTESKYTTPAVSTMDDSALIRVPYTTIRGDVVRTKHNTIETTMIPANRLV